MLVFSGAQVTKRYFLAMTKLIYGLNSVLEDCSSKVSIKSESTWIISLFFTGIALKLEYLLKRQVKTLVLYNLRVLGLNVKILFSSYFQL